MRTLPRCLRCGSPVGEEYNFCPRCGQRLSRKPTPASVGDSPPAGVEAKEVAPPSLGSLTWYAVKSLFRPPPVLQPPSGAVYAKRPHSPMRGYLLAAVVLTAVGLSMGYGAAWLSYLGLTLAGFAAPILYLLWMVRNDRFEREPLTLVAVTFGWGVFCGIFAALLNLLVAVPLLGSPGAAFVEEPLKLLGVYWLARHRRLSAEFNDHLDGMVYGAAAGAGFAGLENLYYLLEMIAGEGLPVVGVVAVRSASSFCHIAWSASAGRSLGLAKALRGDTRLRDLIPGLVVAIPMHFLWNASSAAFALFALLPIYVIVVLRQVRAAQRDEASWGYPTSAPVE